MEQGQHVAEESRKPGVFSRFVRAVAVVVVVIAAAWALRAYVVEPFQIPSASMEDTILTGDMVFTEKITFHLGQKAQPGDIVVFADPQIPSRVLIKRVIATEGQVVDLRSGHVYVNDVALDEPYTQGKPSEPLETAANVDITYPYKVPRGFVWVMGDNRTNSSDSRYFGPISNSNVFGKAMLIYWPLDHFGTL